MPGGAGVASPAEMPLLRSAPGLGNIWVNARGKQGTPPGRESGSGTVVRPPRQSAPSCNPRRLRLAEARAEMADAYRSGCTNGGCRRIGEQVFSFPQRYCG